MSERYSKLFALSENQYAGGSPVVIAAGALLKDNQTGKVIAQLKLRNISSKRIKAATVCIVPFDTVGNPIGDFVSYQYLDLSAKRDEDFGQKAAITLPNAATRSFAATVEEIAFVDNTIWKATGEPWEVLPVPSSIGRVHGAELEKQFRMKYGADSKNLPLFEKDLWYCACGALNRIGEPECHICGKSYAEMSTIDYDALHREKNVRVAAEKEQAEKEAAAARDREEAAKAKAKKVGKITAIVVPILAVIIVAAVVVSGMVKKSNAYNEALALMEAEQYEQAIEIFTSLDGYKGSDEYKDSAEQILIAEAELQKLNTYEEALGYLEAGEYEKAYATFESLGDYKDAKEYCDCFKWVPKEKVGKWAVTTIYYDEIGRVVREDTKGKTDHIHNKEKTYTYNDTDGSLKIVYTYVESQYQGINQTKTETAIFNADRTEANYTITRNYVEGHTQKYNRYFTYDEYGNVLTAKSVDAETGELEYNRKYVYEYDTEGNLLTSDSMVESEDGQWSKMWNTHEFSYNEDSLLSSVSYVYGDVEEYTYAFIYCPSIE